MTVPDRENEAWGREVPGIPPTVTGGLKAGKPWPHRAPRPAPAPPAHPGFSRPRKHVPRQGPPSHTRAREEPCCPRGGNCGGPGGAAKLTPEQIAIRCPRRDATVPKFSRDLAQTTQNPHTHTSGSTAARDTSQRAGFPRYWLVCRVPQSWEEHTGRLPVLRKLRLLLLATQR